MDGIAGPVAEAATGHFGFQEGDLVSFLGTHGRISSIGYDTQLGWKTPIKVLFDNGRVGYFTSSGKCWEEQTEPALRIVELAKPPIRRWQWLYFDPTLDTWRTTFLKYTIEEFSAELTSIHSSRMIEESMEETHD